MSQEERARFLKLAEIFTPYVAVRSGDATFVVSTSGELVGRSLFIKGARGEMATLARAVKVLQSILGDTAITGKTFIDVGGNIGTSTITAVSSYPFADAVACEPEPNNFRLLHLNVTLNDLNERVRVLPVAVSNAVGKAELVLSGSNSGAHQVLSGETARPADARVLSVEQVTIDALVESGVVDPDKVGLLWIDAQGHEGHVLAGAQTLVSRGVPVVAEFHPSMLAEADGLSLFELAVASGYTHFLDLTTVSMKRENPFELRPAAEISAFAQTFSSERGEKRFTDILALRQPSSNS